MPGIVRVSLGIANDEGDIAHLLRTVRAIADAPRSWLDKQLASSHNGTLFLPRTNVEQEVRGLSHALIERVYSLSGLANPEVSEAPTEVALSDGRKVVVAQTGRASFAA